MYIEVINVVAKEDYALLLTFGNNEERIFSVKPYLSSGIFTKLQDIDFFNTVSISFDTIAWGNDIDFDPETLYEESTPLTQ